MGKNRVRLLRSGNRLLVSPTTEKIQAILCPILSYTEKKFFHGPELTERRIAKLPPFEDILWECYGFDHKGRLVTSFGFASRIRKQLKACGFSPLTVWATPGEEAEAKVRDDRAYKPCWDRIEDFVKSGYEFRHKQRECLEVIAKYPGGQISCPPGWGKGDSILCTCMLFPKAKIAVVTKNVAVLQQRLYPALAGNLPSVGIVGGGRKVKGRRVTCYTADSLHHADGDEDFIFVDESHQACADNFAARLARFEHARIWMFSATCNMRLDNKDLRAEALAGPVRLKVSFKEAEKHGMVVPVRVISRNVIMDINPCSDLTGVDKEREAIWSNLYRNELIAQDARLYGDDMQVLITVKSIEHGLHLQRLLPEFELVYAGVGLKYSDIRWFHKRGLVPADWKPLSDTQKRRLTRRFERGKLKKVIATSVWNVGVNFHRLQVIIRADAGGSPINDTQIPGRAVRLSDGKEFAIIHDYDDRFDVGFSRKSAQRITSYEANHWKIFRPKKGKVADLLAEWGIR